MKKLSKRQQTILWLGIIVFLLINAFPPWIALLHPPDYPDSVSIGYAFIFAPPKSPFGYESYVAINFGRLFIQWGVILLATIAGIFLRKKSSL